MAERVDVVREWRVVVVVVVVTSAVCLCGCCA